MNFVDGKSEPQGSVFRFGFAGVSLELSTRQLIPGAEPADVVTLGVDPGRVLLTAAGNPPPMAGVPLLRRLAHGGRWTVERISPDGASDVTLRRGEALWQVVLWTTPADRDRIRPGREVEVWLCPAACHGFAADGRRVLAPRPE